MNLQIRKLALCALPFLLMAVLSAFAFAADGNDAAPVSFTGTWNTFSGGGNALFTVVLKQIGNKVTGSYTPGNGKIFEGVVVGRKVTFKWTQNGGYEGTGEFTLDEDGKGFIGTSTALKPKQFTNVWSTLHKPPSSYAGDWDTVATGKYLVKLEQNGAKVTGIYSPNNGKITDGVVNGKVLRFYWTENGAKGSGRFVMNDDGQSFGGSSTLSSDPDAADHTWNGTRHQPAAFGGLWNTLSGGEYKYGVLLQQTGDKVAGIFAPGNGKITDGVIEDKTLRFKWTQDDGKNGELSGSGHFDLSEDGKSFKGSSNQAADPDAAGNSWNGNRPPLSFAGTWDMSAGGGTPYVLNLSQFSGKVAGGFTPGNGKITDGVVAGNLLVFKWTQDGGYVGTGKLELADDGQSFNGVFTSTQAQGPPQGDISDTATRRPTSFAGNWSLLSAGAYKYILTLQQDGDKVSGSYKADDPNIQNGNGQIMDGKVLGNTVYFRWTQEGGQAGNGYLIMGGARSLVSGAFRNGGDTEIRVTAKPKR